MFRVKIITKYYNVTHHINSRLSVCETEVCILITSDVISFYAPGVEQSNQRRRQQSVTSRLSSAAPRTNSVQTMKSVDS